MSTEVVKYEVANAIATITLNRPEKANTLRMEVIEALDRYLAQANSDPEVKVIMLEGAGDNFCGGFDFSGGLEHYAQITARDYDSGIDVQWVTDRYLGYVPKFMGLWRGSKPTIAKVHGYAVGGCSELALCADLVVASDDARIGTPYSRVWGCHLTGMWVYRLGLAKAKYYALTGEWVSGREAAEIELINFSFPLEELDARVQALAEKLENARALARDYQRFGSSLWDRMGVEPDDLLWYVDSLAELFNSERPGDMAGELRATVDQLLEAATTDAPESTAMPAATNR